MKQKKTKWLIIGIVIGVLLIGAGVAIGVYFYNQNQTEETGKKKKEEKEEEVDLELAMMLASYTVTDPEVDTDGDGIKDGEEEELGLNKFSADTDGDGLEDTYERTESMTDPLLWDTDGDGLSDGEELMAGLDPKAKCSDGENEDMDRLFTREVALEGGSLSIEGAANIYNLYTGIESESDLSDLTGIYGEVHEFFLKGKAFESATLTLTYDVEQVKRQGYDPENLMICQVTDQLELLPVECKNDGNGTVTAELEHFSAYALVVRDFSMGAALNAELAKTKVAILIDNSGSMYDMEGSDANDPEMKRLDMAKQIVASSKDSCVFSVSKFTASYTELTSGWTNDEATLYTAIDGINENENFNGTSIAYATIKTAEKFGGENIHEERYIILLTDGASTENDMFSYNLNDAIKAASTRGITVITIGLGSKVDSNYLMTLSNETGGTYIYANNAEGLQGVNDRITSGMNHSYVDKDGDGEFDHILVADSGFDVMEDGFSFKNYHFYDGDDVINGQCYGMNLFAQLYYLGKLPISQDYLEGPVFSGCSYDFSDVLGDEGETDFLNNKEPLYEKYKFPEYDYYRNSIGLWERDTERNYVLGLKDEWKKYSGEHPLFVLKETMEDNVFIWEKDNIAVAFCEVIALTFFNVDESALNGEERELCELLRALNNLMACQKTDKMVKIDMRHGIKAGDNPKLKRERFEEVIQKVNSGIPLIIGSKSHVANVLRIERSLKNPLEYILYLYDSNYPGEEFILTVRKEKTFISTLDKEGSDEWDYAFYDTDGVFGEKGQRNDEMEFYYWKGL